MSLKIKENTPRKLTLDDISKIIEETVTETEQDLKQMSSVLQRIANISLLVAENLRKEQVEIEIPTTRSLQNYGIVTKATQTALSTAMDRTLTDKTV